MGFFELIALLGGLGLFLYGMGVLGSGLEKLAGGKTESILKKLTSSPLKGVAFGTLITALIQSSSGTSVIVIGLVNSGIMAFRQALGVIMGANIGTTVTAQLISLSDISGDSLLLELLKPKTLAPAIIFAGALLYVFFKSAKRRNLGQILCGFGVLFTGMFAMESAVAGLRDAPWFSELFTTLQNPILGVLAGALVTAAIQSSSASIGILQALTATGAITWGNAIPIILGQNIGTCITGVLAAMGTSRAAKRVAASHVYFNVVGTALWLSILMIVRYTIGLPFWETAITKSGIANFHTLFNVATTLLFLPFINVLARLAEWTVPERGEDAHPELAPLVLDKRLYASPSVAIGQAHKAVEQMAGVARMNVVNSVAVLLSHNDEAIQLAQQREEVIDRLDVSITSYLVSMTELELSDNESREVTTLLNFVTEFERVGDYAINIVERSGEVLDKGIQFSGAARHELDVLSEAVAEILDMTISAFTHDDLELAARVEPLEETVDFLCDNLREKHIRRLKEGACNIEAGIVFLEALNDFERISDHCSNVAARLLSVDENEANPHSLRRSWHAGAVPRYNELARQYHARYKALLEKTPGGESCVAPAQPKSEEA